MAIGAIAAVGGAAVALWVIRRRKKPAKEAPATLQVYGFQPLSCDPDSSPACIKLLTFLRIAKADYEFVGSEKHQFQGSPRGKVPWVHYSKINGGAPMGDSNVLMDALIAHDPKTFDVDAHLTPEQVAVGTAFKVMMEESMYWYLIHVRWRSSEFERCTLPTYFSRLPAFVRQIVKRMLRPKMLRDFKGQGYGLLTEAELVRKLEKEISAVANFLGSKSYFLGDRASSFDATAYAYLAVFVQGGWRHEMLDRVRSHANVVDYVDRMRKEFFPELQGQA